MASAELKNERLAIQLGRSLADAIDRCALAHFTTRSELVRQALIKDLSARGFAPAVPRIEDTV